MAIQIIPKKISIGSLGTIDFTIPYLEIVSETKGPDILLISNQHGAEISSIIVLERILKRLRMFSDLCGTITIMPTANPLGLIFQSRNEPLDEKDLNRLYPGDISKDFPSRIAYRIFEIAQAMSFVIDMHNFTTRSSALMGIMVEGSSQKIEESVKEALKALQPDLIWSINVNQGEDVRFFGALDIMLCQKGIPAIALECPSFYQNSCDAVERMVDGILNILMVKGMVKKNNTDFFQRRIPVFRVGYIYSDFSGIFIPQKKILESVSQGDIIGELIDIQSLNTIKVRTDKSGKLLTLRYGDFVRCGSKLASIGNQICEI